MPVSWKQSNLKSQIVISTGWGGLHRFLRSSKNWIRSSPASPNDGRVVSNFIVQALKGVPITLE
jgi:hypothetical protein